MKQLTENCKHIPEGDIEMKRFVEVHYHLKEGRRAEFYNEMIKRRIAEASRAEKGCEKYEYYLSPEDDNELLLLEVWTSAEAVSEHMASQHYKELVALKQEYVLETEFTRYEISELK